MWEHKSRDEECLKRYSYGDGPALRWTRCLLSHAHSLGRGWMSIRTFCFKPMRRPDRACFEDCEVSWMTLSTSALTVYCSSKPRSKVTTADTKCWERNVKRQYPSTFLNSSLVSHEISHWRNYNFTTAKKPKPVTYGSGFQTMARGPSPVH